MTLSGELARLAGYQGQTVRPADFDAFWAARDERACACTPTVSQEVALGNPLARYFELGVPASDGRLLRLRVIEPTAPGRHPVTVMFHDMGRGVRGWHHMTRFVAAGYGVVALQTRPWSGDVTEGWQDGPNALAAAQLIDDALVAAHVARGLSWVDGSRVLTWGEGLGGWLAMAVAGVLGVAVDKCAVANPMPADLRGAWEDGAQLGAYGGLRSHFRSVDPTAARADELFDVLAYVDGASFAPSIAARLLMGCGLLNDVSRPASQYAAFNRATCPKRVVAYPKWGHERINDFEDEVYAFLNEPAFMWRADGGDSLSYPKKTS